MYKSWFRIYKHVWNNVFSYKQRKLLHQPKIFVPSIIDWNVSDIRIWNKIAFEEIGKNNKLQSFVWLENFVEIRRWINNDNNEDNNKDNNKIIIIDNHNHALYFWREYYKETKKQLPVIHIDQHSDLNIPNIAIKDFLINKKDTAQSIFNYTNFVCNVGNFIIPALDLWIIFHVEQIRTEYKLLNFEIPNNEYILDIDVDFWEKGMSIENKSETISRTKKLIKNAQFVTIATSPFFIEQDAAIDLVSKLI